MIPVRPFQTRLGRWHRRAVLPTAHTHGNLSLLQELYPQRYRSHSFLHALLLRPPRHTLLMTPCLHPRRRPTAAQRCRRYDTYFYRHAHRITARRTIHTTGTHRDTRRALPGSNSQCTILPQPRHPQPFTRRDSRPRCSASLYTSPARRCPRGSSVIVNNLSVRGARSARRPNGAGNAPGRVESTPAAGGLHR